MADEEIEKAMLYYMIFENAQYKLTEDDFFNPIHKQIIIAINKIKLEKKEVSMLSVNEKIKNSNELEYMAELSNYIYGTNQETVYQKLKQYTKKRQIAKISEGVRKKIIGIESNQIDKYIEKTINELKKIEMQTENENSFLNQLVQTADLIEKDISKKEDYSLYTGFFDLDDLTDGLHNGELTVIGARPGVGKTTFALQIAEKIASKEKNVVYVSLEMSATQLIQKILSRKTRTNSRKIRNGSLTEDEQEKIMRQCAELSKLCLNIITNKNTIQDIDINARRLKNENKIDLLIIDYLQLVRNTGNFKNREQEVSDISRTLKLLSLDIDIPVIALCQLNRNANKNIPTLADIRESGALEQDADNVIFLYQENQNSNSTTVDLQKQRAGNTGKTELFFNKVISEFSNIER